MIPQTSAKYNLDLKLLVLSVVQKDERDDIVFEVLPWVIIVVSPSGRKLGHSCPLQ